MGGALFIALTVVIEPLPKYLKSYSINVNGFNFAGSNYTIFASLFTRGQLLLGKEFAPHGENSLKVDPSSKCCLIQRCKQELMLVIIKYFCKRGRGFY